MQLNLLGLIRIIILFIAVIFVIVGTSVAQIRFKSGATEILVFLYKQGPKGGPYTDTDDLACTAIRDRLRAAQAFAVMACIFIGFLFIAVIVWTFVQSFSRIGRIVTTALSIAGAFTSLLAWTIVVGTFHGTFCGFNASDNGYDLYAGAALLIITWILMMIDMVLALLACFGIVGRDNTTPA